MASTSKSGLGGVNERRVIPSDIEDVVHIPLVADSAALEGCGTFSEISGRIEQVTGDGARPALGTGDRGDKNAKWNRFHFAKYELPRGRLWSRGGEEDLPRPVYTTF